MKLKLSTNIEEYKKEYKELECILEALEEQIEVLNNFNIEVTEVTMERNHARRSFKDFKDDKEWTQREDSRI